MNPRSFLFIYPRIRCVRKFSMRTSVLRNKVQEDEAKQSSNWIEKITYSTYLEKFTTRPTFRDRIMEPDRKKKMEVKELEGAKKRSHSVALKFLSDDPKLFQDVHRQEDEHAELIEEIKGDVEDPNLQFPYKIYTKFEQTEEGSGAGGAEHQESNVKTDDSEQQTPPEEWIQQYGLPDPTVPASKVPCGGCGAYLHCQDAAIPGYMPSERFKELKSEDLRAEVCQRCFFLKVHDAALNVNVSPKVYPEILKSIKNKKALVLLVVDLVDFPCSIWPGIAKIIGEKRPVILVGNKADLIPRDSKKYLDHVKNCLRCAAEDVGLDQTKIIDVHLVSAATGYGVEDLISTIFRSWGNKGDIYIMGCTNVGKSTLFNVFLQSDLCKVQAVDLVQRATVSAWPGTTLNLLKFPVLQPDGWRKHLRYERLKNWTEQMAAEKKLREFQLKETHNSAYASLIGYVGRSYPKAENEAEIEVLNETQDLFQVNPRTFNLPKLTQVGKWDPHDPKFAFGKWCYDTPGTVNENQILDKLVLPELMKVLPKKMIFPRSFYLKSGLTMFVGGLARIDNNSVGSVTFTVFASPDVPITAVNIDDADEIYEKALGTPVFGVPMGGKERLSQFPPLKPTNFKVVGEGKKYSCSDIVLSAVGWVAITAERDRLCQLTVHTLNGAGVFLRKPALLPYMVNTKGKRIRHTVAYNKHSPYVPNPRLPY